LKKATRAFFAQAATKPFKPGAGHIYHLPAQPIGSLPGSGTAISRRDCLNEAVARPQVVNCTCGRDRGRRLWYAKRAVRMTLGAGAS
jgi:hypothetical protein